MALGITTGMGSSSVAAKQYHEVPVPDVEGPITGGVRTGKPMTATVADIDKYSYTEEEYFISGTAQQLVNDSDETASYTTRVLVYRPSGPSQFNGTLAINWANVTEGNDVPFSFANKFDYAMREGYVLVIASVQKVGADALREWDPERYAAISHPGDAYSYDIFSQLIQAFRARPRPDPDPIAKLNVRNVIAMGISQSAMYLHTYINEVQEAHDIVDGFIPESIPLKWFAPGSQRRVRDDLVPVLWVNTETEVRNFGYPGTTNPREDGGLFKLWEVAGATHTNNYSMVYRDKVNARDQGADVEWNPEAMRHYGEQGGSDCPSNLFPHQYVHRAALHQMNRWLTRNKEAASAPRLERADNEPKKDKFGNAVGGLRLPVVDVPVALYESNDCMVMRGRTEQFDGETLHELYPTHDEYVRKMQSAVDAAVEGGWLVENDGKYLMEAARASSIPEPSA
ncbi:alpha/beta hydrolase domain-containing protein [Halapricum desulfuricans]|uniref:Alpha/beta hydrolase domain-containing protein n=1 Tax=Halapricum desulfuricans TaxID=2841257 RepID=A0A897NVM6_9EURY|nr:alpha/beta hydrolase domain-containing protein [Halapricum desulfuricans]QSG16291.1 hypothetical protein HSEST_3027 [Halapricum desulfuricans]